MLDNDELRATRKLNGLDDGMYEDNMSEADKMFDDLGFKKSEIENIYIKYSKNNIFSEEIYFHLKQKKIGLEGVFSVQELQAINIKCEELGWI